MSWLIFSIPGPLKPFLQRELNLIIVLFIFYSLFVNVVFWDEFDFELTWFKYSLWIIFDDVRDEIELFLINENLIFLFLFSVLKFLEFFFEIIWGDWLLFIWELFLFNVILFFILIEGLFIR